MPYAEIERVGILIEEGRLTEAAPAAEAVLAGDLPDSRRMALLLVMAQGAEAADAPGDASRWYGRLYEGEPVERGQGAGPRAAGSDEAAARRCELAGRSPDGR